MIIVNKQLAFKIKKGAPNHCKQTADYSNKQIIFLNKQLMLQNKRKQKK